MKQNKNNIIGIISIIFGIVGVFFSFILIGIIPCIISIVLGIVGLNEKNKEKSTSIVGIIISVVGIIIFINSLSNIRTIENGEENAGQETIENEIAIQNKEDNVFIDNYSEEKILFNSGEYHYITKEDLIKYYPNLKELKFYTVIEVDEVEEFIIKSTLDDGYMMSEFNCTYDYSEKVQRNDYVAILGIVDKYNDYGFLGKSFNFKECFIFADKENAKELIMDSSDSYFEEYFIITEEIIDSNYNVSAEEYKSICNELEYEDILRNPDSYKREYCKLNGTVSQVIEGWFGNYSIYIKDEQGNIWGCIYSYSENESHILEGDFVTIYGICYGTTNSETVLGKQVTMPYIEIDYIEIY